MTMKAVLFMLCALTAAFASPDYGAGAAQGTPGQASSAQEARRLWELALAAKGGRERLRSVRNMLVMSRGTGHVDLYAFPGKVWMWMDDRPSPLGVSVEMHNLEKDLSYLSYPNDPESPRRLGKSGQGSVPLRDAQLYFLLETQWLKPTLVGVTGGNVGRRKADVVQTLVNGARVEFYLDRETHLPLRVSFPAADPRGTYYVDFSDYAPVDGIQMPRQVSYMGSDPLPTRLQFNVAYDEAVFERPPTVAAGPEAWRPKR
jgi:hypothetical protein